VLVGIPSDQTQEPGYSKGAKFNAVTGKRIPVSLALIGWVMEKGSPIKGIPARPHLVPGVRAVQEQISAAFRQVGKAGLKGDAAAVDRGLHAAGFVAVNSVKTLINSNIAPPLAKATLQARARRGVTRTNTLVDTGNYRNAFNYFIDEG